MDYDVRVAMLMAPTPKKRGRRYPSTFKAQILAECDQPGAGASGSGIVIHNSFNPDMVQKWRLVQIDINQLSESQLLEMATQMQDALGERDETIR